MKLLELFSGIGGCAVAAAGSVRPVGAIDVNRLAASVYEHNGLGKVTVADLRSVGEERLAAFGADLWWLSPPCQPFTRRGSRRDDEDPRSEGLLSLLPSIEALRPSRIGLENVPGFQGSRTHARLLESLERAGYHVRERHLCPHALGWPNRRDRYYLSASRAPGPDVEPVSVRVERRLSAFVDPRSDDDPRLVLDPVIRRRYREALHVVDREDPAALTATFTSAYGRSHVRSGSYLRTATGVRRFSPYEILGLLGFPESFRLPEGLRLGNAWKLVGNSLSLPAVRVVLADLGVAVAPSADSGRLGA